MYPEEMVAPMRQELVDAGFRELRDASAVDAALEGSRGVSLVVVNSVCGCAAGSARPGVVKALLDGDRPEGLFTVFAGNDVEAVARVREHFLGYPPSSPCVGVFRDGRLVRLVQRQDIQGRTATEVAGLIRDGIRAATAASA